MGNFIKKLKFEREQLEQKAVNVVRHLRDLHEVQKHAQRIAEAVDESDPIERVQDVIDRMDEGGVALLRATGEQLIAYDQEIADEEAKVVELEQERDDGGKVDHEG